MLVEMNRAARPTALTIAGFDPSSGAGMTADLAVFTAHGCFGTSAITALTVQSTLGVRRVQATDADLLAETLAYLQEDLPPAGVKIGMLANGDLVRVVADYLRTVRAIGQSVPVVLDPVVVSSSGSLLLDAHGLAMLQTQLLPLVDVITPNTDELQLLTGTTCSDEPAIRSAMAALQAEGSDLAIVATGGHRPEPDDIVLHKGEFHVLRGRHVATKATHGTGCAFSSAVLCGLLSGHSVVQAAERAKRYVEGAMTYAEPLGRGHGPMRLDWRSLRLDR